MPRLTVPRTQKEWAKMWPAFQAWLLERGSAIYAPTNEYELARFLTPEGIGIVYRNAGGNISAWQNGAHAAVRGFVEKSPWRAVKATKRRPGYDARTRDYEALVQRDGAHCFYCQMPLLYEFATIEHMIPVTAGGTNHLSNKTLACHQHNTEAGHLSVREKLEMAMRIRMGRREQAAE